MPDFAKITIGELEDLPVLMREAYELWFARWMHAGFPADFNCENDISDIKVEQRDGWSYHQLEQRQ